MSLLFFLRILCDMSYYMCYACFVGGGFGLTGPPVIPLLIMAGCCWLAFHLRATLWRLAPLALMGFCWFYVGSIADLAVLVPPVVFIFLTVANGLFYEDIHAFRARFTVCIKVLPVLLLFGLIISRTSLESMSLPFWPVFLFSGVLLLRLLRQSEEILRQTKFKILNAATLLATGVIGFALGSKAAVSAMLAALSAVYRLIFAPILLGISYAFVALLWLLEPIAALVFKRQEAEEMPPTTEGPMQEMAEEMIQGEVSDLVGQIFTALAIIAAIIIIILVFKKMLGKRNAMAANAGALEERSSAEESKRAGRDLPLFGGTPRQRVRAIYRKFLKLCRYYGIAEEPDDTSRQIAYQATAAGLCPGRECDDMRGIYVSARYSEAEITGDDVKTMRDKYNSIKAHINRNN